MIGAIIGAQALSAVSGGSLSINAGIVILSLINFVITFCGNKVLHQFDRYAWMPSFIGVVVAIGCGGKSLSNQYIPEPATARLILSYSSLIAGYYLPWSCLASDFGTYFEPHHSR
jgi:purine-cytosine permease-like protein